MFATCTWLMVQDKMSDYFEHSKPEMCDLNEKGVSAERLDVLREEATAFNHLLRSIEFEKKDDSANAASLEASKSFYEFLSKGPDTHSTSNGDRLSEAGWALHSQLGRLPIEERRALLRLITEQNQPMAAAEPAMPAVKVQKDSQGLMEDLTITFPLPMKDNPGQAKTYLDEYFTFRSLEVCRPGPILQHGYIVPNQWLK